MNELSYEKASSLHYEFKYLGEFLLDNVQCLISAFINGLERCTKIKCKDVRMPIGIPHTFDFAKLKTVLTLLTVITRTPSLQSLPSLHIYIFLYEKEKIK